MYGMTSSHAKTHITAALKIYVGFTKKVGATPLYVASEAGYVQVVKVLLENHANLNLKINVSSQYIWDVFASLKQFFTC